MDKEMSKTHWIIGFLFFLFVMLASGCKNVQWVDQSDLVDDITSGRFIPFNGGDPRIKTAEETKWVTLNNQALLGFISMDEYNKQVSQDYWQHGFPKARKGFYSGSGCKFIGPTRYYLHHGRLIAIPKDRNSIEYKWYLRRTKGYGKK